MGHPDAFARDARLANGTVDLPPVAVRAITRIADVAHCGGRVFQACLHAVDALVDVGTNLGDLVLFDDMAMYVLVELAELDRFFWETPAAKRHTECQYVISVGYRVVVAARR